MQEREFDEVDGMTRPMLEVLAEDVKRLAGNCSDNRTVRHQDPFGS